MPAALIERYAPLVSRLAVAERILQRRLSPNDTDEAGDYRSFTVNDSPSPLIPTPDTPNNTFTPTLSQKIFRPPAQEFFVRTSATSSWKSRFLRHIASASSNNNSLSTPASPSTPSAEYPLRLSIDFRGRDAPPLHNDKSSDEPASPTQLLHAALPDMKSLWHDKDIRAALARAEGWMASNASGARRANGATGWIRVEDTPGL